MKAVGDKYYLRWRDSPHIEYYENVFDDLDSLHAFMDDREGCEFDRVIRGEELNLVEVKVVRTYRVSDYAPCLLKGQ